jgi:hypothetical protein
MDSLDLFFKKYSYKFSKGYPDLNNEQDINLLADLLEGLGINLNELKASDKQEAKEILKKELNLTDQDFRDSGLNFFVLVPNSKRLEFIDKIENIDTGIDKKFKFNPQPTNFSSIGYFMYGDAKFGIKPSEKQGGKSAGLENENNFANIINSLLEDGPKDIKITDGNKEVVFENITKVIETGRKTSGYSKSDIDFYSNEINKGGLSLKQDNAIYWESADVRFKNEVKNLIDAIISGKLGDEISYVPLKDTKGNPDPDIIRMYNKKEDKPITGVIIKDLPPQDLQQVIFGNDNVPVAIRTWRPSDFKVEGNIIIAKASKLYTDLEDVEKNNALPILNIRHDKTRRATKGLRAFLQTEKSLYKDESLTGNNIELSYNKIIS